MHSLSWFSESAFCLPLKCGALSKVRKIIGYHINLSEIIKNTLSMKCISSLISSVTLIVYVFCVLFEIFFVLIWANCIIAHTAVCTGCFSYKSCMDKLHSGIVGIAHCRHHFRQIMFPCKIRNRNFRRRRCGNSFFRLNLFCNLLKIQHTEAEPL